MQIVEIVRLIIELALLAGTIVFGKKFKQYRDAFVKVAEAVKDDKVTWDETQDIVKELEEK